MESSYLGKNQSLTYREPFLGISSSYKSNTLIVLGIVAGIIGTYFILASFHVIPSGLNAISALDPTQCSEIGYSLLGFSVVALAVGTYKKYIARDSVNDYSFAELKNISDQIINNVYWRTLVKENYQIQINKDGYEEKVPVIVEEVRGKVEFKLNKPVKISHLMEEMNANRFTLVPTFPYMF